MSSTLDSIFGLGREYVRARYSRTPDPAEQGAQAVPIPAATVAQAPPASSGSIASPAVLVAVAVSLVLIVGLALKKAG